MSFTYCDVKRWRVHVVCPTVEDVDEIEEDVQEEDTTKNLAFLLEKVEGCSVRLPWRLMCGATCQNQAIMVGFFILILLRVSTAIFQYIQLKAVKNHKNGIIIFQNSVIIMLQPWLNHWFYYILRCKKDNYRVGWWIVDLPAVGDRCDWLFLHRAWRKSRIGTWCTTETWSRSIQRRSSRRRKCTRFSSTTCWWSQRGCRTGVARISHH